MKTLLTWLTLTLFSVSSYGFDMSPGSPQTEEFQNKEQQIKSLVMKAIWKTAVMTSVCTLCCASTPTIFGALHGLLSNHQNLLLGISIEDVIRVFESLGIPEFFNARYADGFAIGSALYPYVFRFLIEYVKSLNTSSAGIPANSAPTTETTVSDETSVVV